MKGMTIEQYKKVLEFIGRHHNFAKYTATGDRIITTVGKKNFKMSIKYVESSFDMRDNEIWQVRLYGLGMKLRFSANHYTAINPPPEYFKFDNLYEWVMGFLDGSWTNMNILKQCQIEK